MTAGFPAFASRTAVGWAVTAIVNAVTLAAIISQPAFLQETPFLAAGIASLGVLLFIGLRPAIATQVVTLIATEYFLFEPTRSFAIASGGDLLRFTLYAGFLGLADLLAWRLERSRASSRQGKRELLESETRYRLLLEQASDGIVLAHPEGRLVMANQRACELLGYTEAELLALPLAVHYAPGELENAPLAWTELEERSVVVRERQLCRKDGSTFIAELSVRRTADGYAQAILRDVTERRQSETALRAERDLLDGILTTSVAGILVVQPDGRPIFLNSQARRVLGVEGVSLDGLSDLPAGWRLLTLEGQPLPSELRPTRRVVASGEPIEGMRLALERPDGERKLLSINAAPLRDAQRRITAIVMSVADVTEQDRAREAVRASEEKLRQVAEAMPGVVYQLVAEADGRVRFAFVSERAQEFLSVSAADILQDADRAWATVDPDDLEVRHRAFRRVLGGLEPWSFDFRVTGPQGRTRWLRDIATALPGRERGQSIWSGVMVDITERKRLEVELLQSQKMDSLGRLAGGVAHDFNNVLTVIRGYADVLMGELGEADPRRNEVGEIRRAADRAGSLTRQLLAMSRRQVMVARPVELNALVAEMERMLRRVIGEDIAIVTLPGADVGWARADQGQLEQVLLNLAVNARDAMPRGGTLTIETRRVAVGDSERDHPHTLGVRPGDYAMLRVSDTGIGMDGTTVSKAFEPFFTTKPLGEGTGLGLSTVYGIIQQSNGHVTIDSTPGIGTTFRVFLPRYDRAAETDESEARPRRVRSATGRQPRVLLVEDDEGVRQLTRRVLEESGFGVVEARSAREALALIRGGREADVLVTDVVMPGITGRELAAELRRGRPDLPVLYLSGYTGQEVQDGFGCLEAFLQKPYSPDALTAALEDLLADSRPAEWT
ncbi:MAG TPA: PAS domain S-box protein [Gemmatimonadales bacterium]|nr:PAS domain S-box protein [Gemmatimonadales bacterium]